MERLGMRRRSKAEVDVYLRNALDKLLIYDGALLAISAHEITICAKLACYLQSNFFDWHVDVEYNRDIDKLKTSGGEECRPDIIIHERTSPENNHVVIEVKKRMNWNFSQLVEARGKLITLKNEKHYDFAFLLVINTGEIDSDDWYDLGEV
jgi:hypothetical protein